MVAAKSPGATFETDISHRHDRAAARAGCPGTRHRSRSGTLVVFPSLRCVAANLRYVAPYAEDHPALFSVRFHCQQHALAFLFAQPSRLEQGQRAPALFTGHGTRPEIGHRRFGDPTRILWILEISIVVLGVERSTRGMPSSSTSKRRRGRVSYSKPGVCGWNAA